jgi:hypothetical protein
MRSRTTDAALVRKVTMSKTGSDERAANQQRIGIRLRITRVRKPDEISEPMRQHPPFLKMGKQYLHAQFYHGRL